MYMQPIKVDASFLDFVGSGDFLRSSGYIGNGDYIGMATTLAVVITLAMATKSLQIHSIQRQWFD